MPPNEHARESAAHGAGNGSYTRAVSRGHLRIYLGAAPGVGKTFAMLNEGWRRHERGTDVVIGYIETHGRPNTLAQLRDLEIVPRRRLDHRGVAFEEMDVDAILVRSPKVTLVDELAHTNVTGSRNEKRWEDVQELLDAGIDVISTVNIQHLESVNDVVERVTGVKQRETVPDAVVREADQVELVDMTPEALRRRMAHGNIYVPEKVDAALGNYFRVGNLAALRELALLWVADKVDDAMHDYMVDHDIDHVWETRERVVVAMTGAPSGEHLIRRGARMAQRGHGDLVGVHVRSSDGLAAGPNALLERHRQLLADLGGEYHEAIGADVADTMLQFARRENATQLVLGASRRSRWSEMTRGSVINRVIRQASEIDVHVISAGDEEAEEEAELLPRLPGTRRRATLSRRRQVAAWTLLGIGLPALTVVLTQLRGDLNLATVMLLYLSLACGVAALGAWRPAVVAAVAGALCVNWYFTPPIHTWTIAEAENVVALVIFVGLALLMSLFVTEASARRIEAQRARAEAEALARVAGGLAGDADPVMEVLVHLRSTFDIDSAAVLVREEDGRSWQVESAVGPTLPRSPDDGESLHLDPDHVLVLLPPGLAADDRRVLSAFASQLSAALEQRELRERAAIAEARAEADQLRTAILRAVSHDLRTPLAGIKASATSLLADDVDWSDDNRAQFLHTIDDEADRLDRLVGNLLDMSRIESGALDVSTAAVGLDEIVGLALDSLSVPTEAVTVDVPTTLPLVGADPALLERAIANLVSNALTHSAGSGVNLEGAVVGDRVVLRVVDRGPGIGPDDRERVFAAFQRLGDGRSGSGVGLGLAVARGFVSAMGGNLVLDDTPGGGLTATVELRSADIATQDGGGSDTSAGVDASGLPVGHDVEVGP
jgi:two-component system sensor histidine kinase KdpD